MEKIILEDDIKGLEQEIDSAVDHLFVEKKKRPKESLTIESPILEPSYSPPSTPPLLKWIERMETQLLSLEWEVTRENLEKTKEEIFILGGSFKEKPDIKSVLNFMDKVLDHMIEGEENIRPPQLKYLLDSMETIKLLMKREQDGEISIYKKLAYAGIEARFSCLEELKDVKIQPPSFSFNKRMEIPAKGEKQIEEMLNKINFFSEKIDGAIKEMDQHLSKFSRMIPKPSEPSEKKDPLAINITIFKVGEKLFGVESDKIFKLFKVPNTFHHRYSNPNKIRLKHVEVKMVDLKKIFSIRGKDQKGENKILTVKDNGEYKGWMVVQVLKKLSLRQDMRRGSGEYFSGIIHWIYEGQPVEIPILNLKKF